MTLGNRFEDLRGDCGTPFIPAFDPQLYRSANCDQVALPARSVCGACGFRKWRTSWENANGLRIPLTRDAMLQYVEGTLNLRWHRDAALVPYQSGDSQGNQMIRQDCTGRDDVANPASPLDPEVRAKQDIIDVFYTGDPYALTADQFALMRQLQRKLIDESAPFYGWLRTSATCVGAYIPPAHDWGASSPIEDDRYSGFVPPRERRVDCLIALNCTYTTWVDRWTN